MGGVVSAGRNNGELIDNLLEADYIKSSLTERVFRAVDRAEYFLPQARMNAYKDLAWKSGNLHLSAPCIYCEVIEALDLAPGMSFLNLGSGTGYLSTMIGLILGTNGVNHGIELHEDVVEFANKKLEDFKKHSGAIDEYDFCEPKFLQGNCLCLTSESSALYDRIYCGAACPEQYETYMKNLLKVGGMLVMPQDEQLLQIRRVSQIEWTVKTLLPVSFASLITPPEGYQQWIQPIPIEPLSLQVLCRAAVRSILRKNIETEHPPAKKAAPAKKAPKKNRDLRKIFLPLTDSDESSEEEPDVRLGRERRQRDPRFGLFRRDDENMFRIILGNLGASRNGISNSEEHQNLEESSTHKSNTEAQDEAMETENSMESTEETETNSQQVRAVIEHNPNRPEDNQRGNGRNGNEISGVIVECLNVLRRERMAANHEDEIHSEEEENTVDQHCNEPREVVLSEEPTEPSTSGNRKGKTKREKFDSGLGDEIIEAEDSSDENEGKRDAISSSCDEDCSAGRPNKRETSSSGNEGDDEEKSHNVPELRMYESPYTEYMRDKIQKLPLPPILKRYVNFFREF